MYPDFQYISFHEQSDRVSFLEGKVFQYGWIFLPFSFFTENWKVFITSILRFLSTLWPILQLNAHHIQDKLAVSFDSSSIGLISYKCFLTIDAKFSSVKAYNEENSFFREKNTFSEYSKSIICMYILTLSPLLIYEGRSKICKFIFISHQVLKP